VSGGTGSVILQCPDKGYWLSFSKPVEVVQAALPRDVRPAIRRVDEAVSRRRLFAAGFVSYEASPAFDTALKVRSSQDLPLAWFGLYESAQPVEVPVDSAGSAADISPLQLDWTATVSRGEYENALHDIKGRIAAGSTYQVNYTYRLRAPFNGDPRAYFSRLAGCSAGIPTAGAGYAAFIDLGRWAICSVSPELFFTLKDGTLVSRPMKGTAPRGRTLREDDERAAWLRNSEKNRAENLMIVDMIRNDMGRIADVGTVQVPRLCEIEKFPTVLQMTSTVTARVPGSLDGVLSALFPCASITGAPKVSTMGIIAEIETTPRGVYTGAIGYAAPRGSRIEAQFNVAIRTVTIDRALGRAEYGVGGGILWESDPGEEYRECEIKTRVLRLGAEGGRCTRDLLEAVLWTPSGGWFLLERHLGRLSESARFFDVPLDMPALRTALEDLRARLPAEDHKVRIVVDRWGKSAVTAQPLSAVPRPAVQKVCLASAPVDSEDPALYHKTADREVFDRELREHPACDDVLLWNERGEVTESCTANVVADVAGTRITPPVSSGLLAGVYRSLLLEEGVITEGVLPADALRSARSIWLINSVRKWMPAVLVDP
jgi:para-aminobenzoate synthetase / 4-amino-4-deoxychorismate lyase